MTSKKPTPEEALANSFRPNAGIVVLDLDDRALAFRRIGTDAWQFPQGGIDPGEMPIDAMWRELGEETGLDAGQVALIGELPEWIGYEVPEEFRRKKFGRGQVQRWFFLRVKPGALDAVETLLADLPPEEFDAWKWTTMDELATDVIEFRKPIYRRLTEFAQTLSSF